MEALVIDDLATAPVPDRLAREGFCEVGRDLVDRDGGIETVALSSVVSGEELNLSPDDEFGVGGFASSSGAAFR